ncbi:alpha/beta fold hydrolase [Vitreimonas flagellata]|uniref:alpha/beta fold hydrolase n=1 Tax=Vitreimonas flagellata TaxID=2560861 RepID=UPI0010751BC5|nr:alpha/beta hydrolase [Vitreimonas flagellata]
MGPENLRFAVAEGVQLLGDCRGSGVRGTILLAHGAGQTRHAWAGTATRLAGQGWRVISLDLRGHGDSDWPADGNYRLTAFADDLAKVAQTLAENAPRPHLVGASLGGLAGLMVETHVAPGVFASLTLVDIVPQMDPRGVERIMAFMTQNADAGFASVEQASALISAYLPHRPKPRDLSGLSKNLRLGGDGRYRWHWDPRFVASVRETRQEHNLEEFEQKLAGLSLPLHLVRGRMSELVPEDAVRSFLAAAPNAHFTDIADAGHMVAGDRNDAFCDAVAEFLSRLGG